jgi:hypothetical protein
MIDACQIPSIKGHTIELGDFSITWSESPENRSPVPLNLGSVRAPEGEIWKARGNILSQIFKNDSSLNIARYSLSEHGSECPGQP